MPILPKEVTDALATLDAIAEHVAHCHHCHECQELERIIDDERDTIVGRATPFPPISGQITASVKVECRECHVVFELTTDRPADHCGFRHWIVFNEGLPTAIERRLL